ncbi:MAG: zinc-dependent alcohol dehydrogenase [Ilumatobacter sp.]|uniref:zinc-dependent alcohol dehydrogenase n=1 Tax=Ilumatobacter sp. TaxID=1967498 RepID=UPI0032972932
MRAAVVHEFGAPLAIEDIEKPEPGPGEVVVKIETSGLCHTDVHAACGDWPVKPGLPFVPGHEGVGLVERVGAGVSRLSEGDRVAVPWLGWACGACEACASGWESLCPHAKYTGYTVNGGFADYTVADASFAGLVPGTVDPLDAAPLTCAGVTTYKAVKVSGAGPSDLVAVVGIGGLGHLAVQYAKIAGATVVAIDVVDSKLEMARQLGAAHTINASTQDPIAELQALGGADAAIVLAATPQAAEQALAGLRRNGQLVLVGLPKDNTMKLPIFETVLMGKKIVGSLVGTRVDLAETFELHADGRTKIVRESRQLEQVNESMDEVLSGTVDARLVFDLR